MKVLAAVAVVTLVAGPAHAQAPGLGPDGRVSRDAFIKTENEAMLGRLDANGDGRISKAEMKPVADRAPEGSDREGRLERMWARSDQNGDGFIDRTELDAGAKQRFDRRDANKDGWLTGDELSGQGRVRGRP